MIDLELLGASELCAGLAKEDLKQLARLAEQGNAAEGQQLHSEAQEAEDLFLLNYGKVELRFRLPGRASDRSTCISVVEPGGFFGWSALVPPHKYTLDAVCSSTTCRFYLLHRGPMLKLFKSQPEIGYKMMSNLAGIMGRRFRSLQEELVRDLGHDLMHGW